jgi:uncharacterized membrane protein YfcA
MLVMLVAFAAVFVQSSIGFGFALVSMPLLVALLGIQIAAPLVALLALVAELFILIRYREGLNLNVVLQLTIAAVIGVPIGVLALGAVDEQIITALLGIILVAYALYALFSPHLPTLAGSRWAYGFGLVAGMLGGAYNTPGPPVILFGHSRRWPPAEFKGNLQGFFLINSLVVVGTHLLRGNFTGDVRQEFFLALPGLAVGMIAGFLLSNRLNAELFGKIVLVLLIVLGVSLIVL